MDFRKQKEKGLYKNLQQSSTCNEAAMATVVLKDTEHGTMQWFNKGGIKRYSAFT
jgi:hypothetical protein